MSDLDKRLEVQSLLESIMDKNDNGEYDVYFQPGANVHMNYPAIVYSRDDMPMRSADDTIYKKHDMYKVVIIDPDPDSVIVEKMARIPTARFNTHYAVDNLNHDVFTIFK